MRVQDFEFNLEMSLNSNCTAIDMEEDVVDSLCVIFTKLL